MPFDPTEVRSRDELLMGAIATGDSTVIGDPRDRNEEFIKAIADGIGSAGGQLYLHRTSGTCTDSDDHTYNIVMTFLNHNSETITTKEDIIANLDFLIAVGGECPSPITVVYKVTKVSATIIRMGTIQITQDENSKVITASGRAITISTLHITDTVTAL